MRLFLIAILLFSLMSIPMGASAEEMEDAGMEIVSEEPAPADEVQVASAATQASPTIRLAPLFGAVHGTLLMATEEAFGYLLMDDEQEKQAFFDDINASEEYFAAFETAAETTGEEESVLLAGYEETKAAYQNMITAADDMFASYEETGSPVYEDVMAFEEAVDTVFNATETAWDERDVDDNRADTADGSIRSLYVQLLSAIEESYAYPVLGDIAEKEDVKKYFTEFDDRVAIYEEKFPDTSYEDLKAVKEELQVAAMTMFERYEAEGLVVLADAQALETVAERINDDYRMLISEFLPDEDLSSGEPAQEDDAAHVAA